MNESSTSTSSAKKSGLGMAVVALVIGLVIGFGVTQISANHKQNQLKSQLAVATIATSNTKAADLRANLVTLGVSHMILTDQAVNAALLIHVKVL